MIFRAGLAKRDFDTEETKKVIVAVHADLREKIKNLGELGDPDINKAIEDKLQAVEKEYENPEKFANRLKIKSLWSILILAQDDDLFSDFQFYLRRSHKGCRWKNLENAFNDGVEALKLIQEMGEKLKINKQN